MKKVIRIILLILAMMFVMSACGTTTFTTAEKDSAGKAEANTDSYDMNEETGSADHQKVKFTMEDGGSFIIELYPEYAPRTVQNFVDLVSEGFYDGLTFHRIVDGFMAQGGDPMGTGMGGSSKKIKGEFSTNGYTKNTLSHTRGVVSMARSNNPNSASSQFFICYGDATFLDGQYAAFGQVIEGMEVVDSFLETERTMGNDGAFSKPIEPIVIEKAEVI